MKPDAPVWKAYRKLGLTLNTDFIRSSFLKIYSGSYDEGERNELMQQYQNRLIIKVMKAIASHFNEDEEG